jgi:hypothetical protein
MQANFLTKLYNNIFCFANSFVKKSLYLHKITINEFHFLETLFKICWLFWGEDVSRSPKKASKE